MNQNYQYFQSLLDAQKDSYFITHKGFSEENKRNAKTDY